MTYIARIIAFLGSWAAVSLLALLVAPGVAAAEFLGRGRYFDKVGARWFSVFLVSLLLGAVAHLGSRVAWRWNGTSDSIRRYLCFLCALAWIMCLQAASITVALDHGVLDWPPNEEQAILTATLTGFLWPLCNGRVPTIALFASILVTSLALLMIAAAYFEPSTTNWWMTDLGLIEPPKSVQVTGRFLETLPVLAGLPPVTWSVVSRRSFDLTHSRPETEERARTQ